jgi:ketosteroid isomerase-like protein
MDIDRNGPLATSDDLDHVVCPECGSEFQPHVTRCIDCGAATVAPGGAVARTPEAPAALAADVEEEVPIRTEELEWIESLRERFAQDGIPSRIEALSSGRGYIRYRILVAKGAARRAFALDHALLRERLGDDGTELADIDIPPVGTCPLCGSEAAPGSPQCPHCGLRIFSSNLEIVQALYAAFAEQDREQILAIFDPEIEWIQNEGFPGGGRFIGAEAVMDGVFDRLGREWEGWGAEVDRWLDAGESIVALGEYHGTNRATGRAMTAAFAHVLWLRGGRVVRFEQYADTATVVAACRL